MSQQNNQSNEGLSVGLSDELSKEFTIYKNVKQEIIITTADKVKIVLLSSIEILTAKRDWIAPAGIFVTLIITLITADFQDVWGMSKDFWCSLFVLLSFAVGIWLIVALRKLYINYNKGSLDSIIEQIQQKEEFEETTGA